MKPEALLGRGRTLGALHGVNHALAASRVMTCLSGQDEEKLPFGEHPDDALPYETFAGEGICGCGRTLPKMATCGYCLCLAD